MTRKHTLHHLAGLALVLTLSGCSEEPFGATNGGLGGAPNDDPAGQGGGTQVTETGGNSAIDNTATGGSSGATTDGTLQLSTGGTMQLGTGGATQVSTGGAAQASTGGAAEVSTGGAAQASTGGAPPVISTSPEEPLCVDDNGAAVPYDFSIGLMGEYAFELSMSCEVGGYLMPLVMADPEQLSEVNAFVATATDWYRADILNCDGATTQLDQSTYGLLPVSQSGDLSDADVDASLALFSMVLDRHDGQADAVSADKKGKIKNRINSVKQRAVHGSAAGLTKTLTQPDCVPAAGG